MEEKRKEAEELISQKKSKLRSELFANIEILREWGIKNILDEKAADIYDLTERAKGNILETIKGLEDILYESQILLNAVNQ